MNSPVTFEVALRVWGDPDVNLSNDETRRAFFAVWALLIVELEEARKGEGE